MNKKTRDWLFRIFVFLFVIITITLSLYATGYRFNLSWPLRFDRLLLKTGTLALATTPKGATVTIASETKINSTFSLFKNKEKITPIKIKNLLPGDYLIAFSLDGYWPYQKKLKVNPEQTTFLEDVILFKKSLPVNTYSTTPQEINYSPTGNYAWLVNDKIIIDLKTEQAFNFKTDSKINWLDDNKQISDGSKIINLNDNATVDYAGSTGKIAESQMTGDFLIYQVNNSLSALNVRTKTTRLLVSNTEIVTYRALGNILFIITKDKNKTEIKSLNLQDNKIIGTATLLNSHSFSFKIENKNLTLQDNEHKIIYLLTDNSTQIIKDVIRGATVLKWLDNNKIAYANESEIYLYDLIQMKPYLITRLSEKINSLSWSASNYLVYATDKTIGTINLIDSGNDITVLWQGNNLSSLYLDNKNGVVYFSGSIGQQSGLYKMILK